MRRWLSFVVAASLIGGCGGGGTSAPVVAVYTSFGSVQCSGGGSALSDLQRRLIDAGVRVLASRCGLDGLSHLSVCGQPDGRIAVFDIDEAQVAVAMIIGFALLSALPNATTTDCP